MFTPLKLIGALWIAWLTGWVLASPWSRRTVKRLPLGSRLLYSVFVFAGAALYFRAYGGHAGLYRPLIPATPAAQWAGAALVVAGLGFTVWARAHLGRLWSGSVTLKEGHTVIRSGPYRLSRHPIYSGMLLAAAGTSLAIDSRAALAGFVLMFLGFVIKSAQEESLLVERFGEEYREYRRRTRRLIPYVW
jgi:protein-S-isoprenylcysteine O-methyltransferase Ste14